jgi:hypothetical protein
MVVHCSHECNAALAQVSATGAPSHHLKVLLPIRMAMANISAVQTHRSHVYRAGVFANFCGIQLDALYVHAPAKG